MDVKNRATCISCSGPLRPVGGGGSGLLGCSGCGLCVQAVTPLPAELELVYSEKYYDSWGGDAHEYYWELKKNMAQMVMGAVGIEVKGKSILDVGCATGASLAEFVSKGAKAFGVDVNPYAVQKAKELVPAATVYHCGVAGAALDGHQFDIITMFDVLEHVLDPVKTLIRVKELLAPNGSLVVLTPNFDSVSRILMAQNWPHFKKEHLFYFSKRSLKVLFKNSGFVPGPASAFWKPINLSYAIKQFEVYRHPLITPMLGLAGPLIPGFIKELLVRMPLGEVVCVAQPNEV